MIDVLAVASEVFPLVKTGGLADVVGALPAAVKAHGIAMRTIVPGYPAVLAALAERETLCATKISSTAPASLIGGQAGGLDLIVLDAPHSSIAPAIPISAPTARTGRTTGGASPRFPSPRRTSARGLVPSFTPAVIHAHDWQAGLVAGLSPLRPARAAKCLTINNLAFQGTFPATIFAELRLPPWAFSIGGIEYYGGVGFLKSGMLLADADHHREPDLCRGDLHA